VRRARFLAPAREEFLAEVSYYDKLQQGQGERFAAAVEEATAPAAAFPDSGSLFQTNVRRVLVKRFPFSSYIEPKGMASL